MIWLAALVLAGAQAQSVARLPAPAGWRYPTAADFAGDWAEQRDKIPEPFHARGDFDHDGHADDAWLLLPAGRSSGWALFVFFGSAFGTRAPMRVWSDGKDDPHNIFIDRAEPGNYETACGKGYWDCAQGEPSAVTVSSDVLTLTFSEGSDFLFTWNAQTRRFKRIQMSD